MKKVILVILTMGLMVNYCAAQNDTIPAKKSKTEQRADKAKKAADEEAMLNELGLTDEQKVQFREIIGTAATKSKAIKDNTTMTDAEKDAAKKVVTDEKNTALKALLGNEKYKQYNAIKKRQKEAAASN